MLLELASRQQQDIVKTRIKWMKIADVLKGRAMPAVENNVMCTFWLITIRVIWKNDGDLIVGGIKQIVTVRSKCKAILYCWCGGIFLVSL